MVLEETTQGEDKRVFSSWGRGSEFYYLPDFFRPEFFIPLSLEYYTAVGDLQQALPEKVKHEEP